MQELIHRIMRCTKLLGKQLDGGTLQMGSLALGEVADIDDRSG